MTHRTRSTSAANAPAPVDAARQLDAFIDRYLPEIATLGRSALAWVRDRAPGATELVYDNYNGLVVGFGPSVRPSQAILSVLFVPRWVTLCFLQGAQLADPQGLLRGSGNVVRHVRIERVEDLAQPGLEVLVESALGEAKVPMSAAEPSQRIIQSISAKQRPRRPRNAETESM